MAVSPSQILSQAVCPRAPPYLCRLVGAHAAAQLEALAAGLGGPARGRGGGSGRRTLLLLPQAVALDLLADEQLAEPLALGEAEN